MMESTVSLTDIMQSEDVTASIQVPQEQSTFLRNNKLYRQTLPMNFTDKLYQ